VASEDRLATWSTIMRHTSLPTSRRAWAEMIASAILLPLIVTVAGLAMIGFIR
jgi:hypothetical protein